MNIETADRLLRYRKKFGFSQEELAEKIGVSRQAISKWERGESSPDTDNLILLAQTYGVTIDELLLDKSEILENNDNQKEDSTVNPETIEEADEVKTDKVSFKNGIHVHSKEGDKVDISFAEGIHVDSHDGSHVHIDGSGVHVNEGEVSCCRKHNSSIASKFPIWIFSLIAFFVWGFSGALCGFALSWICFLVIPIYYTLISAVDSKNPAHFAYPVLCVMFYMIVGFLRIEFLGGWTFGWLVFLTIPLYYFLAEVLKQIYKKSKTQ